MPGTSTALGTEWSLLLAACSAIPSQEKLNRIRPLLQKSVPWMSLNGLADQQGTMPLLYRALRELSDEVPANELASLKQYHQANLHKALLLSRELFRILDCLSAGGVEVLPYKGLALAEVVYGDIALRQAGDIDLLIRPDDLARIRNAVRDLGYTPHLVLSEAEERAYLKSGYECAFDGAAGRHPAGLAFRHRQHGVGRLHEEERRLAAGEAHLLGVLDVVAADAVDAMDRECGTSFSCDGNGGGCGRSDDVAHR